MNAYELNKWIDNSPYTENEEVIILLRQQADRIAELEKECKELHKIAQVMAMQESDARKSLQNYKNYAEPVAWMHQNPDYSISKHRSLEYNIPLYTHPAKTDKAELDTRSYMLGYADGKEVKTLTDEEIIKTGLEIGIVSEEELTEEYAQDYVEDVVKFAKAILRKAQEV